MVYIVLLDTLPWIRWSSLLLYHVAEAVSFPIGSFVERLVYIECRHISSGHQYTWLGF